MAPSRLEALGALLAGLGMARLKTRLVDSLKGYIAYVEQLRTRGSRPLWYRGCARASYKLKPSLYRHKGSNTIEDLMRLEKVLLERFKQRSIPFHARPMTDEWEWLFLMQHYGVPTRLLDWTESPLMALFFAATSAIHRLGKSGKPVFSSDAAIWVLSPEKWNKRAVDLKSFGGEILTTDDPNVSAYKPVGDVKTMKLFPVSIFGAHNSQRIVAQRGVFVCFGKDVRPMETLYERDGFPPDCLRKLVIRRGKLPMLYQCLRPHGLTDSVAFPDLDGLAREIKREYGFEV